MKSILSRVTIELLSSVYRADRGQEAIEKLAEREHIKLNTIPDSTGMTFEGFLGMCKKTLDVYEGEKDDRN